MIVSFTSQAVACQGQEIPVDKCSDSNRGRTCCSTCFVCCLAGAGEPAQKDDIVYIRNVVVGRETLDQAQYEQLVQQVEFCVIFASSLCR